MVVTLPEGISTSIWRYGFFEADVCLALLLLLRPGMTFVDVGAHIGFFSLLASHLLGETGRVLAVEPTPRSFKLLRENIDSRKGVHAVRCAAYSDSCALSLTDFGVAASGYNSVAGCRNGALDAAAARKLTVPARPLDELLAHEGIHGADVVKIDVESAELEVLKGLKGQVAAAKPTLIVEVGDLSAAATQSSSEVVKWLTSRDYLVFEVDGWELRPHEPRRTYDYGNLVFMSAQSAASAGLA